MTDLAEALEYRSLAAMASAFASMTQRQQADLLAKAQKIVDVRLLQAFVVSD